jgi:hypothetical protein
MNDKTESFALEPVPASVELSPATLLRDAIKGGLTKDNAEAIATLAKLYRDMEDRNAEREYAVAFAALQRELKGFHATKSVPTKTGGTKFSYLEYNEIMAKVRPLMEQHGFSVSFSTDFLEARIVQTCTLQHIGGHHRDYKAAVRAGAGPNGATETQADGAAMTYAKRYALCNALNIVVEKDTDGVPENAKNEGAPITPEQAQYLREQVRELAINTESFFRMAGAPLDKYEEICNGSYPVMVRLIEERRRSKK